MGSYWHSYGFLWAFLWVPICLWVVLWVLVGSRAGSFAKCSSRSGRVAVAVAVAMAMATATAVAVAVAVAKIVGMDSKGVLLTSPGHWSPIGKRTGGRITGRRQGRERWAGLSVDGGERKWGEAGSPVDGCEMSWVTGRQLGKEKRAGPPVDGREGNGGPGHPSTAEKRAAGRVTDDRSPTSRSLPGRQPVTRPIALFPAVGRRPGLSFSS